MYLSKWFCDCGDKSSQETGRDEKNRQEKKGKGKFNFQLWPHAGHVTVMVGWVRTLFFSRSWFKQPNDSR